MKDEKWLKDELRAFIQSCKENAKENREQAKECETSEPKRAHYLEGGAEAMDHAVTEIRRILKGQTSVEALVERLAPHMTRREAR